MANLREMRIFSADQIEVPTDLPSVLKEFSKEVIKNNPENLVEFCRMYFQDKMQTHGPVRKNQQFAFDPEIERISWEAAQEAMRQFDINGDNKLSKEEAEPMLRSAFDTLKGMGKLPPNMADWNQAFHGAFKMMDADNSGFLEVNEVKRLAKFLLNQIRKGTETAGGQDAQLEQIAWEAAEQAMGEFDANRDGKLSQQEAEPMLRETFEVMKQQGKLPQEMGDFATAFREGFKMLDVDGSGALEIYELKNLCMFILRRVL